MSAFDAARGGAGGGPKPRQRRHLAAWRWSGDRAAGLRSSPDQLRDAFGTTLVQATDVLTVPIAALPDIQAGDAFVLGTDILTVQHAERDAAGVAWRVLCQR